MTFQDYIAQRFQGRLTRGSHTPDGAACFLEAVSQFDALDWTDNPGALNVPELRPLNDGPWSSAAVRTHHMAPLYDAIAPVWRSDKRHAWVEAVVIATVREIIAEVSNLPTEIAARCR